MARDQNEQAETAKAPAELTNPKSSAGSKVIVACRLPHGLVLHLDEMVEQNEVAPQGFRTVKLARQRVDANGDPMRVVLNGTAAPHGLVSLHPVMRDANGQPTYALTENVDKGFWDAWLEANKNAAYVKNGQVFAFDKRGDAEAQAKEFVGRRSGLEPLVPDNDPRARGIKVTEEEERAKARKAA